LLPEAVMQWLNTAHSVHVAGWVVRWPTFEFVAGWLGLTCYSAAFIAEEFQAGLRGVPAGQHHAAAALGLTPLQAFCYVVLPQAVRISLPPLFGQYMNLVKNSSLTMAIGLAELSYAARQVETETFQTFAAFGVATLLYIAAVAMIEAVSLVVAHRRDLPFARR
jgi:polar amino acid transport system permease protein